MTTTTELVSFGLILAASFAWTTCAQSPAVTVTGRHLVIPDPLNASLHAVAFDFNGVTFNTTFAGLHPIYAVDAALTTTCFQFPNGSWSTLSQQPNRFTTHLNGTFVAGNTVDTNETVCNTLKWFRLISSDEPLALPIHVSLFKITEPNWNGGNASVPNFVLFHAFRASDADGRETTTARHRGLTLGNDQQEPTAVVENLRKPGRASMGSAAVSTIEFIGDSITAGYCNLCNLRPPNTTNNYALEDFTYSWATRTCRAFSATCHTEAWSGRGLIRNCDASFPTVMPQIVQRALATVPNDGNLWGVDNAWNFSMFVPNVVVVNLGTNDYGCNPIENMTEFNANFETAYVGLVTDLLTAYRNETQAVMLACGPMLDLYCPAVLSTIGTLRSRGYSNVHFLNMTNAYPPADECCGHPDTVGDSLLARLTISAITSVLAGI